MVFALARVRFLPGIFESGSSSGQGCPELLPELSIVHSLNTHKKKEGMIEHTKAYSNILMKEEW